MARKTILKVALILACSLIAAPAFGQTLLYFTTNLATQNVNPIDPSVGFSFPNTPVGQSVPVLFGVKNLGNTAATITAIATVPGPYVVSQLSLPLPAVLQQNDSITFLVTFTPTAPLAAPGRLQINNVLLPLSGTGLGALLAVTANIAGATTTVNNNDTILFSNTMVGSSQQGTITVTNNGNIATSLTVSVTSTSAGGSPSDFTLSTTALSPTLAQNQTVTFQVVFAPHSVGTLLSGVLSINNLTIQLRGVGSAPNPLPGYSFTGVSGSGAPLQQPSIGLQLSAPYSATIYGTLTLSFASTAFVDDPSIQFSTGGRTVNFTIPANTNPATALFGQLQQIQFQTGTVAGTITITPSFFLTPPGSTPVVSLTPTSPTVQTVQIPAGAPQIRAIQLGAVTATSFQIVITGYSTPRSVSSLALTFTPSAGGHLQTTTITVSSDSAFQAWYQTALSATVGSQFSATLLININSGAFTDVGAVSVVASNAQGSSAAANLTIH